MTEPVEEGVSAEHQALFRSARAYRAILCVFLAIDEKAILPLTKELALGRNWLRALTRTLHIPAVDTSVPMDGWVCLAANYDTEIHCEVPVPFHGSNGAELGVILFVEFRGKDLWGFLVWKQKGEPPEAFEARCRKLEMGRAMERVRKQFGIIDTEPPKSEETMSVQTGAVDDG